ncbi:hypothetical protein ACHAXN_002882 [Cyclotella atomus]
MAIESRHRSTNNHIILTPLPEQNLTTRQRRRRKRDHSSPVILLAFASAAFLVGFHLNHDSSDSDTNLQRRIIESPPPKEWKASLQHQQEGDASIRPGSVGGVVSFLMNFAEKRPGDLWSLFGMDDDGRSATSNPFSLSSLEGGSCPFSSGTIEWLPPLPAHSTHLSSLFASSLTSASSKKRPQRQKPRNKTSGASTAPSVVLWYEHISKAGGTTFCGLANTNMPRTSVPRYHCMPRKGDLADGRVGSWDNDELVQVIAENEFAIVANEWDPFDLSKLKLSGRDLYHSNTNIQSSPALLFVSTLRDPADRLLSSYTFFSDYSEIQLKDPMNFGIWMKKNLGRVRNFKIGEKTAFRSNIARNNYMVWRFSGGNLGIDTGEESFFSTPSNVFPSSVTDKSVWKQPFETAIRALSQHDLLLPMDVMTNESGKKALKQVLGWSQFTATGRGIVGEKESGHVVTTGEVRNSNAKLFLEERESSAEFKALWERNWLDYILWYWARAVFFTRLNCAVVE